MKAAYRSFGWSCRPLLIVATFMLQAVGAAAQQDPIPPPNLDPGDGLRLLMSDVDSLLQGGLVDKEHYEALASPLHLTQYSLWQVEALEAIKNMEDFTDKANDFLKDEILDPQLGQGLVDLGNAVSRGIASLLETRPPLFLPDEPCPEEMPVLYVDDDAPNGGDGSVASPFNSISAALDSAAAGALTAVEIQLASGEYRDHVEITRHTRIVGDYSGFTFPVLAGSIRNLGPFCLDVNNLVVTDDPAGPAGGLSVVHDSAHTSLNNVYILNAVGFGLVQRGGTLAATGLSIVGTVPLAETVGVAMQLDSAVHADLQDVLISRNHGGALLIKGPDTQVVARRLFIQDTELNPYSFESDSDTITIQIGILELRMPDIFTPSLDFDKPAGRAALDIRDAATFSGEMIRVLDSDYVGVYVGDGVVADFRFTFVDGTRGIEALEPDPAGHNIMAAGNSALFIRDFIISRADLVGVVIARDGNLDLMHGEVSENAIGIGLRVSGYDFSRFMDHVFYHDNGATLEATDFPVPEPAEATSL